MSDEEVLADRQNSHLLRMRISDLVRSVADTVIETASSWRTRIFERYLAIDSHTEEENAIMGDLVWSLQFEKYDQRDRPEGTIITDPYYTDFNVLVTMK